MDDQQIGVLPKSTFYQDNNIVDTNQMKNGKRGSVVIAPLEQKFTYAPKRGQTRAVFNLDDK